MDEVTFDKRKLFFTGLGLAFFCVVYFSPAWPDAVDPAGKPFALSHQGKAALALFLLAATWWVFEVVPIGVTSIMIGTVQALFLIREPREALTDFLDPSVWFIMGSLVIGMSFTKSGLTKRIAYKMLALVGEKTSMIYLGCFAMTAALTLIMAHTAVAATIFPLLMTIYALYDTEGTDKPTKFGKGLFIGMAYVAGAGSIITLLGAARGAVAIGFFREIVGRDISFFGLTYYMLPVGALMTALLWVFFMIVCKPEKKTIPGLREQAKALAADLGGMKWQETVTVVIVGTAIVLLAARSLVPESAGMAYSVLQAMHKSAVLMLAIVLFFVCRVLTINDLEDIPWNIILLFGGAMSIGFCLWRTGAADWLAVNWLLMFQNAHWFIFVIGIGFFVLVMTNFIMNVAAIAISMPVALTMAPYLGVSPEVIIFAALVTAGMPFLLLVGAAPNAIAYESKQFTSGEFFLLGLPASIMLLFVLGLFVAVIWPLMGCRSSPVDRRSSESLF